MSGAGTAVDDDVDGAVVLVIDDHPIVRRGLVALLTAEAWVARIVEATTVREAGEAAATSRPDVAIVDLNLPDGHGADLLPRLRRSVPSCRLLVLTMAADDATVRGCLAAGASGFVLKDSAPAAIVGAVRTVLGGGLVLGPTVSPRALVQVDAGQLAPPLDRLSPTEVRILAMVGRGARNAEIATALGISDKTVRNRLATILASIGAGDRVQAALLARDAGLHDPTAR